MIVSIHQPDYIPWLGYFDKINKSDIFVFLDDAQFSTDNIHNWNKVKTPQGELKLKIPVEAKLGMNINEVRTRDELKWKEKHLKSIEMNYKKAPYFDEIFPELTALLNKEYADLAQLNIAIILWLLDKFKINTKIVLSSQLKIETKREEKVIDICKALDATEYYSGNGAKAYQVEENFTNKGIKLTYTSYTPFEYKQLWGDFIPALSVLDYVFNCGFDLYN